LCSSLSPSLGSEALEFVDRDKARAPTHHQRLDEREDPPVERRRADAQRLGRLASGVREPYDTRRLTDDYPRIIRTGSRRRVTLRLLCPAAKPAAGHADILQL